MRKFVTTDRIVNTTALTKWGTLSECAPCPTELALAAGLLFSLCGLKFPRSFSYRQLGDKQ